MSDHIPDLEDDVKRIFESDAGGRVLRYLMDTYWFFETTAKADDPTGNTIREGSRMVILDLVDRLGKKYDSEAVLEALNEHRMDSIKRRDAVDPTEDF